MSSSSPLLNLNGLKGVVLGVANPRSIGWAIASFLHECGAEVGFTYLNDRALRHVKPLADSIQAPFYLACNVQNSEQVLNLVNHIQRQWGQLDFIVHSLAFAHQSDLKNPISACSQEGFKEAMEISAWSLLNLVQQTQDLLNEGASITTLSYIGAERVVPLYGVMGPVKAALEAEVRYLAHELGPREIRVNAVSAGPIKTLSAAGIPGFRSLLKTAQESTAFKRGVSAQEVAHCVALLVSPLSRCLTGEVLHVDCGASLY